VQIKHLFGTFSPQSLARLGAAIARGMALRAFCTSSMGLSKVFLRHIAPERAREDQNLPTGPHFSAGHAEWRYINKTSVSVSVSVMLLPPEAGVFNSYMCVAK
jgi:hypothetical protein